MNYKKICLVKLLFIMVFTKCNSTSNCEQCDKPASPDMKFSVSSFRNETGQWVAQIRLQHGEKKNTPGSVSEHDNWNVDVEQTTIQCGGVQSVQITATITGPPPKTAPGYEYYPGVGFYKFHTTPKTWDEARRICEQESGHLAVVNSQAEADVLMGMLAKVPNIAGVQHNDFVFVGFHDRFTEGEFITVFGTSLGSTGWGGATPQNADNAGGNENCGSFHRSGILNDIPCPWKLAFFCEQQL